MGNSRCRSNSFYTAEGVKLRDGDGIYVRDGRPLRVVAGSSGEGSISVHDLPQGARIHIPGMIDAPLSIDHDVLSGHKGRGRLDIERLRMSLAPEDWGTLMAVAARNIPQHGGQDRVWGAAIAEAYMATTTPLGLAGSVGGRRGVVAALAPRQLIASMTGNLGAVAAVAQSYGAGLSRDTGDRELVAAARLDGLGSASNVVPFGTPAVPRLWQTLAARVGVRVADRNVTLRDWELMHRVREAWQEGYAASREHAEPFVPAESRAPATPKVWCQMASAMFAVHPDERVEAGSDGRSFAVDGRSQIRVGGDLKALDRALNPPPELTAELAAREARESQLSRDLSRRHGAVQAAYQHRAPTYGDLFGNFEEGSGPSRLPTNSDGTARLDGYYWLGVRKDGTVVFYAGSDRESPSGELIRASAVSDANVVMFPDVESALATRDSTRTIAGDETQREFYRLFEATSEALAQIAPPRERRAQREATQSMMVEGFLDPHKGIRDTVGSLIVRAIPQQHSV